MGALSGDFMDSVVVDTEEIADNKDIEYKYVGFNPDAHPPSMSDSMFRDTRGGGLGRVRPPCRWGGPRGDEPLAIYR